MLKTTAGLIVAGAIGVGLGYGASELLRPTVPPEVITKTETATVTEPLIEEQVFNALSTGMFTGTAEAMRVHVRAGRVAWCEPFSLSEDETKAAAWTIAAGDKTFQPNGQMKIGPQAMAARSRLYCPDRLRYPMKRVGYAPGGGGDVSNRGKGEFVRITWDEAFDLVAKEVKRIQETYGLSAILAYTCTHENGGIFHHGMMTFNRFMGFLGGYTPLVGLLGTWQHWPYAGPFIWGFKWNMGAGDDTDNLTDTLQNSKLGIFWGITPTGNETPLAGHAGANWRFWMKEAGMRLVSINPILEDTGAVYCDQWIPIIPGTDAALALAIANVWIKEGTFDKNYVATHTVGFDKFSDYVLGKKDGPDGMIDRTPDWASKITGVDTNVITALAREWGSKPTSLMCIDSGINRTPFGHEWCRLMVTLQAMQGLGKPGVNIWHGSQQYTAGLPMPVDKTLRQFGLLGLAAIPEMAAINHSPPNPVMQTINREFLADALLTDFRTSPPLKWRGGTYCTTWTTTADAFTEYTYPMPGYSDVHMLIRSGGGGGIGMTGPDVNSNARALKSPKLETMVILAPRLEPEVMFSDIVLPVNQALERNDLLVTFHGTGFVTMYTPKAVESLAESKSDYEIYTGLAERLGFKEKYTDGNSEDDWLRKMYMIMSASQSSGLSWEEFKAKGYYVYPYPKDYKPAPGLRWYYEEPEGGGLDTPSGKIEIQSKVITDFYGEHSTAVGDVPKYFVSPFGRYSPFAKKYPLQINAQHSKYRVHTKWNNASDLADLYKYKGYEPADMNPADAEARGIKEKDIVRIFNDTGQILCYAHLTERIILGVVHVAWGSWYKPLEPGNPDTVDTGGEYNTLQPKCKGEYVDASGNISYQTPHCLATYGHAVLAEMELWKG